MKVAIGKIKKNLAPADATNIEFLALQITTEFMKEKERQFSQKPEETLGQQFEESKKLLAGLRQKLELMTKKKPETREETLEMRFIRAWISLLTRGEGAVEEVPSPPSIEK